MPLRFPVKILHKLLFGLFCSFLHFNTLGQSDETRDGSPFSLPRPVSKIPFDYKSLDPSDYMLPATRLVSSIKLDGHLDEADWLNAEIADKFFQLEPFEGAPASHGPRNIR